jgi:signal peptidase I
MEMTEIVYWSLFALLTIGEILVVYVYKLDKKHVVRDWVEPAFEAIIIATVLRIFIIQAFRIPTESMEDTLLIGDHIVANKFIYGTNLTPNGEKVLKFKKPKRGDVIIFRSPEDPKYMFIKRCMGLPGDTIEVKDKILYINGNKMDEKYIYHKDPRHYPREIYPRDNFGPVVVPPKHYFAMGDNRDRSSDSRFWGFLPEKNLRGQAWAVYWPPSRWRIIKHEKVVVPNLPMKAETK